MILSINARLLIVAGLVLASFLGMTGVTLENSYRISVEDTLKERLQLQLSALIASMEQNPDGSMALVYALPEPRFFTQGSGLYAKIIGNNDSAVWASPSITGVDIPFVSGLSRGQERFDHLYTSSGVPILAYSIGLTWGENEEIRAGYTFVVAETLTRLHLQERDFRRYLWAWLGALSVVLLFVLTFVLRWGLAPLRAVAADLHEIEAGHHISLEGHYPRELRGLTDNLNALIATNREHEARYRASLGDLAHSLKTPLAVLRGAMGAANASLESMHTTVHEQIERMDQIVQYQLQRAAVSGRKPLTAPVDLNLSVTKVVSALKKVYADKGVVCNLTLAPRLVFHCDEGDLMEILGNIVDNAFKWCRNSVDIRLYTQSRPEIGVWIEVADNGPGISEAHVSTILKRGGRLDMEVSGHGLGLAMVQDIVSLYGGQLSFSRTNLGGAKVMIFLPGE